MSQKILWEKNWEIEKEVDYFPDFDLIIGYSRFCGVLWCIKNSFELYVNFQNDNVIAYASSQLKLHEKNYPTHGLELAAIVLALKICRDYLYGFPVDILNDYKIFQYVFT